MKNDSNKDSKENHPNQMGLFKAIGSFMFLKPHSPFLAQFPSNELWLSIKGGDTSHLQDHRKCHNLFVKRGSLTEWQRKERYIFGILY